MFDHSDFSELACCIGIAFNSTYINNINLLTEFNVLLPVLILKIPSQPVQALLVRERILGPAHPDTSYYIRYRGAVYADMGHFERCITLWMYALDMQQKILEPLSPMTQSSLLSFAELFSFMMSEGGRSRGQVPFANLGGGARAAADLPINENMNQTSPPPVSFADIMTVRTSVYLLSPSAVCSSRCSSVQSER